jgi:ADP-ribose pyrophosphatase YjhB (NUDIX family)
MKFNNILNEVVNKNNISDRSFWISRSCAVTVAIILNQKNKKYVLMSKRGQGTPDFQGFWNMPCGYLDWNETCKQAVYREVFEETGLNLDDFIYTIKNSKKNNNQSKIKSLFKKSSKILRYDLKNPWAINDFTDTTKQNITLRYGVEIQLADDYIFPTLTNEHCEPDEVDELEWVEISKVGNLNCAFNHNQILKEYLKRKK